MDKLKDLKYDRIEKLLKEDFYKLKDINILLLGVGGVGGVCLDCLYASGVKNITIVDYDKFELTNQNRQIWSRLHDGEFKVDVFKKYYNEIKIIRKKIDEEWIKEFDFEPYDIILDAIDDTKAKIALALKCHKKLISSFGSAKRLDPTKVKIDNIWKTKGDKLGAKIRYELRKRNFNKKYKVVYSTEEARTKEMGSFMGVTATFGLFMCYECIKKGLK